MNESNALKLGICILSSGSKGNSVFISDDRSSILFDAGLSGKELEHRMSLRGLSSSSLKAIIVSHEHIDHIRGVGVLSRRFKLPVYISQDTFKASEKVLGILHEVRLFECGKAFKIESFTIYPFSIPHDAIDPSAFTVILDGYKIGIATDMGSITNIVKTHLKGCHILVIEANHDTELLINGPYPWNLKQRIRGRHGHLSNNDLRALLSEIKHKDLKHLFLAHLSEENNDSKLAVQEALSALSDCTTQLHLTSHHEPTCVVQL